MILQIYPALSQTFSKKTFTTDNGLSNNFVQHITQDQTGFLWISTWDGLNRYDGYEFKNYFHKPDDLTTVPFFVVDKSVVDGSNNVWVMCQQRAVVIYNRSTDSFDRLMVDDLNELFVSDITLGPDSTVWLFSMGQNKLYHFDSHKKLLSKFQLLNETGEKGKYFSSHPQILVDNKGEVWIISIENKQYEVFKGDIVSKNYIQLRSFNSLPIEIKGEHSEYKKLAMYDINVSNSGQILLFSKFGLFYFDPVKSRFIESSNPEFIGDIFGKPNYFWSDEKSGIHIIETRKREFIHIKPEPGKFIENLFVDLQKTIWVADITDNRENIGLNRYVKNPSYFRHYLNGYNKLFNANNFPPKLMNENSDKWIAMRGLNNIYQIKKDGSSHEYSVPKVNGKQLQVVSMTRDTFGIWLGCTDNYLFRYDFSKNIFNSYFLKPEGEKENINIAIHNILSDKKNLIINGRAGIYKYNTDDKKLHLVYSHAVFAPCFCIISDNGNGYWIGVNNNTIKHLDMNFNELATYRFDEGMNNVEYICIGDNNDIWVALMGGGLGHLFTDSGKMEVFTTADGLVNNTLLGILKDKNSNLWISTNKGISFFNTHTKQFRSYGKPEGVLIEEFNSDANYLAEDGQMFFGGVGGMIGFFPDSVEKYTSIGNTGQLLVTGFKVSGIPRYFEKPIYELDTVKLNKGDNNFQLTFSRLDFNHSEQIKYRYRLYGKKNSWTETDYRQRNINYANLIPGEYKLEIESANSFGEWDSAAFLIIFIPSFFYQTIWFKILIFIGLFSVIAFAVFLYNRQIRLTAKQKQNELRLESLRGQMNPHFIFNALNSINYFISNNDKISANNYIADFSRLIRSILNNLSHDFITFEKELESIKDYLRLEHLRFSDKFNYEIKTEIENKGQISVFPGLVQPLIENAIWHGVRGLDDKLGFIKVSFIAVSPEMIRCVIEDDGIGRKQAEIHKNVLPGKKSRGIGIVSERLKIISEIRKVQYNITFEDVKPGKQEPGTRVTIDLPIQLHTFTIEKHN